MCSGETQYKSRRNVWRSFSSPQNCGGSTPGRGVLWPGAKQIGTCLLDRDCIWRNPTARWVSGCALHYQGCRRVSATRHCEVFLEPRSKDTSYTRTNPGWAKINPADKSTSVDCRILRCALKKLHGLYCRYTQAATAELPYTAQDSGLCKLETGDVYNC
jgi:hypothetical protein